MTINLNGQAEDKVSCREAVKKPMVFLEELYKYLQCSLLIWVVKRNNKKK